MTEEKPIKAILALMAACTIWGLGPLFWKLLSHVPPIEVLAHRTFWSMMIFAVYLGVQGRLSELRAALGAGRQGLVIAAAALMISINWFLYIWSIANNHAVEASLGYFLFPLVAVLLGKVVFGETLSRLQWAAIALAGFAVIVLAAGLGVAPWIALTLAASFGVYGLIKKQLTLGPVVSVTAEVLLMLPVAMVILARIHLTQTGAFGQSVVDSLLLIFSGLFTATPLMLLSYAAKRVSMATFGLVQYLNPTLQFFCAVVIFGEPFGLWHAITFPMIWVALLLYAVALIRQDRASRRSATKLSSVAES